MVKKISLDVLEHRIVERHSVILDLIGNDLIREAVIVSLCTEYTQGRLDAYQEGLQGFKNIDASGAGSSK